MRKRAKMFEGQAGAGEVGETVSDMKYVTYDVTERVKDKSTN